MKSVDKIADAGFLERLQIYGWFILLDVAILVVVVLLLMTSAKILFFHIVFILLTFGAFFWRFHAFAIRAVFWVAVTTAAVFLAVFAGQVPLEEMIEMPLLTSILILVFAIAQQRSSAQEALRKTNEKLESRVAARTAELTAVNVKLTDTINEHKQTEKALRESEERYRRLVELSFEAIAIHSAEKLVSINTPGAKILGAAAPEEVIGRPILDFAHPDYLNLVRARMQQISEEGKGAPLVEEKFVRLDGTEVDVEVASVPIIYRGQPAVQSVIRDITGRKRAEVERERLLAVEQEQRLLAETLGEVFLALTAQTSSETVLDEILQQVQRLVAYRAANIALLVKNTLQVVRRQGYQDFSSDEAMANLEQPLADFPLDAAMIQSQQPLIVADTRQNPHWITIPESAWIRSSIAVPICLRDAVLGLLRLDSDLPGKFSARDAECLLPLANAAAIALENARLHDQARQKIVERLQAEKALRRIAAKNQAILDVIPDSFFHLNRAGRLLDYRVHDTNLPPGLLNALDTEKTLIEMLPSDLAELILAYSDKTLETDAAQIFEYQLASPQDSWDFEFRLVVSGPDEVLAIVRDITERKASEAAIEKERARLARDLHDSLGQSLAYLHLKLDEFTSNAVTPRDEEIRRQLLQLRDVANEAYELVRSMIAAARSANATDLATALLAQAKSAGNRARFKVQLTSQGPSRSLSPIVQHQVLYIFQEALNNVVKHAQAGQIDINLLWRRDALTITLVDDGCGFTPRDSRLDGHFGLTIMQERAEEINGSLSITSSPNAGTELTLQLPLTSAVQAPAWK